MVLDISQQRQQLTLPFQLQRHFKNLSHNIPENFFLRSRIGQFLLSEIKKPDLLDSGMEHQSPTLEADSLPSEPPGKAPTSLRNHTVSIRLIKTAFSDAHLVTRGPRNGEQPGSGRSVDGKSFGCTPGPRARHSQYATLKGGQ